MAPTVTPTATYSYRCLGPARLEGPGGRPLSLKTRKVAALLYLLARQPGKAVAREEITELFWPGYAEAESRHSLAQTVSLINKELGGTALETYRAGGVTLREGLVTLDVTRFEAAVKAGDNEAAHALWGGRVLEGLNIPRAPDWEHWLAGERARVERLYRGVLHALGEKRRAAGDWEGMERMAETLLTFDSLDEKAMLLCLESMSLRGDRTAALRRYSGFEHQLREELGAEPSTPLTSWAARARQRSWPPQSPQAARSRLTDALPAPRPVFGRDAEFSTLYQLWTSACKGHGVGCLIRGDAGIGKTALVTKLANQVHVAGGSVCYAHCYRSEASVPFAPISTVVRQLARQPGFVATSPHHLAQLAGLVAELFDIFPHLSGSTAAPELTRYRLCDAVLQSAINVSEENPLLLVVEDLNEADEATTALLHFIIRHLGDHRILVVTTMRPTDNTLTESFVHATMSATTIFKQELGPLTDEAVGRLIEAVLAERGVSPTKTLIQDICRQSGGYPLRAVNASLATQATRACATHEPDAAEAITDLRALPDAAAKLATLLAISGRPLTRYELARLVSVDASDFAIALDYLERAQLVRQQGNNIYLSHESYGPTLARQLTNASRTEIHRALADHLRSTASANPADWYLVASHYLAAGAYVDAVASAREAAAFASSLQSTREEAAALRIAIESSPSADPVLLAQLAECYFELGEIEGTRDLARRWLPEGGGGDFVAFAHLACAAETQYGARPLDASRSALEETVLEDLASSTWHPSRAYVLLLRIYDKLELYEQLRRFAKSLRRRHVTAEQRTMALFAASYLWTKLYDARRALGLVERVLALAIKQGMRWLEMECRDGRAVLLKQAGRLTEARSAHNDVMALARKRMHQASEANALLNRAVAEIALGDMTSATESLAVARQVAPPGWPFVSLIDYNLAFIRCSLGHMDAAAPLIESALLSMRANRSLRNVAETEALLSLIELRRGRTQALAGIYPTLPSATRNQSWAVSAARAWGKLVLDSDTAGALQDIGRSIKAMSRHDAVDWLSLRHEGILIAEAADLDSCADREALARDADAMGAAWIAAVARQRRTDVVI